jgi:hypothetical protein
LNGEHFVKHITFKVGNDGALYVWKLLRIVKTLILDIPTALLNIKIGPTPNLTISQMRLDIQIAENLI